MASNHPTRDQIAVELYQRPFSQLSVEAKSSVNKVYGIMLQTMRSGGDPKQPIRAAANSEAILIVKQLKEIAANPGDQITLPKGVLEDAARVVKMHYEAQGNKKPLSAGDINAIRREVKVVWRTANPEVVKCVADYLTNSKGRFSGVGPKTLRRKLRSFLSSDELEKISDKEILSTRDITISHLFDKWTHGNLTSFVRPKVEDLLEHDVKQLQKKTKKIQPVGIAQVEETLKSLETLHNIHNSPTRSFSNPFVRRAMYNLGLTPDQIISPTTKEAMGDVVNAAHAMAMKVAKGHPKLGGGILISKNPRLHTRASSEYRESIPTRNVHSGIGKRTTIASTRYKGRYSEGWKYDIPSRWSGSEDTENPFGGSALGTWLESDEVNFGFDPNAEAEYNGAITTAASKALRNAFKRQYGYEASNAGFSTFLDDIEYRYDKPLLIPVRRAGGLPTRHDAGPKRINNFSTGLIPQHAGSVTAAEERMGISQLALQQHEEDIAMYNENLELYQSRYGNSLGARLLEGHVPLDIADQIMRLPGKARWAKATEVIDWYSSGLKRHETDIFGSSPGMKVDDFTPFSPFQTLAGHTEKITPNSPLMKSVAKFYSSYENDAPTALPDEIANVVSDVAHGKTSIPGTTRVGIVGSKGIQDPRLINKWLKANWDDSKLMITSTEVGKNGRLKGTPEYNNENYGAAFHASNFAHHNKFLQYKFPVRSGGKYNKDMTTADVINASDEVVAFFDSQYLSASDVTQLKKLRDAIGDKPARIVWMPSKIGPSPDMKTQQSFLGYYQQHMSGIPLEAIYPGSLPKSLMMDLAMQDIPLKYLAKGGPLKSNEMAIVGEAGPELLVPAGAGGFNVLPNKDLRKLYNGTIGLSSVARDVTGEPQPDAHDYTDPATGEIWPSVTKIMSLGKKANIAPYYGSVGDVAHYTAAKALGAQHGIDVSHVNPPKVVDAADYHGNVHSAADIAAEGTRLGEEFVKIANDIGFIPTMIERRFVNMADKYSGTVDMAGNLRDELGNLVPAVADFKTGTVKGNKDIQKFAEQMGGYAQFFSNQVDGVVIHMSRDMNGLGPVTVDIIKGAENFRDKLAKYNEMHGPRPVRQSGPKYTERQSFDAMVRDQTLQNTPIEFYDAMKKERYVRAGLSTTVPGHAVALEKTLPKFEAVGPTPDETWDKNPSRLAIFGARLKEIETSLTGEGVHPAIRNAMGNLAARGWDADTLNMLAGGRMGEEEDDKPTIDLFNRVYQSLKPHIKGTGLLDSGENMDKMLWEDARTILNVLEEAAKTFESIPRLPHMAASSSSSPGILPNIPGSANAPRSAPQNGGSASYPNDVLGGPVKATMSAPVKSGSKCKGVDLCAPTMSRFEGWFKAIKGMGGMGGGPAPRTSSGRGDSDEGDSPEKAFAKKYLGNVEHATGFWKKLEHSPIIGTPLKMYRQREEWTSRTKRADQDPLTHDAPMGYWKLLEKEDQARSKYLRSIRGATTSFLIAQHVMRIFGQTSQVYAKGAESVGKGLGYIYDMFLMPLVPIIAPITRAAVGFGNFIRQLGMLPLAAVALTGLAYAAHKVKSNAEAARAAYESGERIPNLLTRMADSFDNLGNVLTGILAKMYPMPDEISNLSMQEYHPKVDEFDQLGDITPKLSKGINKVPGTGNSDSVLAMLTPGEMVIPKGIATQIRGYAEGGIVGGASGLLTSGMGMLTGAYSSAISSDVGIAAMTGLGMVSKTVGALMAPMAPALAGMAIAGKGFAMVKGAVERGTQVTQQVSQGGFAGLRTMAAAQLAGTIGGLAPLLPIGVAIAGIYAWTQGFGPMAESTMRGLGDAMRGTLKVLGDAFNWLKDRFKAPEIPGEIKTDKLPDGKLIEAEEKRRADAKRRYGEARVDEVKVDERGDRSEKVRTWRDEAKEFLKEGPKSMMEGVPGMALTGGVIGAMESKNPMDWAISAGLGGAAQAAFNIIGKIPYVGGILAPGIGAAVTPGFSKSVAHAITQGEGPLSPSQYIPALKGNEGASRGIEATASMLLSSGLGGLAISPNLLIKDSEMKQLYTNSDSGNNSLQQILTTLKDLMGYMKQPTINQNTFEIKSDDDYRIMQMIDQRLAQVGKQSGAQFTG